MSLDLAWLPELPGWSELLETARHRSAAEAFAGFQQLANSRIDFVRAGRLDKAVQRFLTTANAPPHLTRVKLAILGSSTLAHLLPAIRVGGLRRGLLLEIYLGPYGLYRQELADPNSGLHRFRPDAICFAFDASHLADSEGATAEAALATMRSCWAGAREQFGCRVVQQTVLPRLPRLMGNAEDRLASSPAAVVDAINFGLRPAAAQEGVSLLALDSFAVQDGLSQWFEESLWFQAKQEVHPRASVLYGDQLGRLLAALWGRSAKCLVLDLDHTLWGGGIGDDGLNGIVLGQGSPVGEAFVAFQRYAKQLAARGIILAVCSKNDEHNALEPFEKHPDMVLRRDDIACFVANWTDKATNLREIATRLKIGLDSLVFADDNPAERQLVRRELPMVAVPEMPEDPAEYVRTVAAAGYFEAIDLTAEDRDRTALYRANAQREAERLAVTDMDSYLAGLRMQLTASSFDLPGLKRIVQLINKTNQFNLTTRRYAEADVHRLLEDDEAVTLQLRLTDLHGDNGIIAVVIAFRQARALVIDTWLMSCRVLGRGVEDATLNLLVECAHDLGCTHLQGEYLPTAKNGMVSDLYPRLGFTETSAEADGRTLWQLDLRGVEPRPAHIEVTKGAAWIRPICTAS